MREPNWNLAKRAETRGRRVLGLNSRASGLTLVELAVVTVILAFLSTLAATPIRKIRERAGLTAVKADLRRAVNEMVAYEMRRGSLPRRITDIPDFRESRGVVICRFQFTAATRTQPAFVRIDGRYRGTRVGVQTRWPTWNGRMQEQSMNSCANVRGGSS